MLLLVVGAGALEAQQSPPAQDPHVRAATAIVQRLRAGEFEAAAAAVDPAVPAGVFSAEALGKIWQQVREQQGELQSFVPRLSSPAQGKHLVDFDAVFQKQPLTLRVVVDDQGRLSGLWLLPPAPVAAGPSAAYVDTARFSERDVVVGMDPWKLPGTLSLPKGAGPFPAVVLVHGSGPNDRDETVGPNRPFRDLAGGLASRGVAVLRYDKRTRVHGARMAAGDIGLEEEVVADALMALDTLRHTPGVDPRAVFLLGHSMGAFMAPMIAERDARLAGAILLAGNTGSVTELTAEQLRYIASLQGAPSPELQAMIATVDSLREGRLPESALVLGAPARYWHELDALRPIEVARRIKTPLLILQGGRDYQVPPRELGIWRGGLAGRPRTDFHEFPALNHLFIAGSGPSSPAEYQVPGHVDAAVVDEIASWILGARTEKR